MKQNEMIKDWSLVPDEYRHWVQRYNASIPRVCEICGQDIAVNTMHVWFLRESGNRLMAGRAIHTHCAVGHVIPTQAPFRCARVERIKTKAIPTPTKRWDIHEEPHGDPVATVGFGRPNIKGGPGIRTELLSAITSMERHKERVIVAKNLTPRLARLWGRALIEAANQADAGQAPPTKRSGE